MAKGKNRFEQNELNFEPPKRPKRVRVFESLGRDAGIYKVVDCPVMYGALVNDIWIEQPDGSTVIVWDFEIVEKFY